MPIYEYRCNSCGRVFEVIQKFSDDELTADPECGKGPVERLISAPSFQFKGSGFYITDYNKGKDGGAKTASDGKSNGSGESKPDSGSDSKSSDAKASESKSSESKASDSKSSESKSSESSSSSKSSETKSESKSESKPKPSAKE